VTDDAVAFRSGWWTRRTSIVRVPRIQVLAITDGVFDRRWGMASLQVDTAGATAGGHAVYIPYLDRSIADRVFARLREAAARTDLQW
jgi:putative membrane protein